MKIIDYIKSHLYKELGLIITYYYPVYKAIRLVLGTIGEFKYYIKNNYNIIL